MSPIYVPKRLDKAFLTFAAATYEGVHIGEMYALCNFSYLSKLCLTAIYAFSDEMGRFPH